MYVYFTLFLVSIYVNKNTNPQYPSEERTFNSSIPLANKICIKATGNQSHWKAGIFY
ncbi:hypothetical protein HanPI659440_Chr09g0318011 [Helianthus annuus]|nr:hypothetical protein HanPI659440_Chr09g0318011 [Helianthus annuus]